MVQSLHYKPVCGTMERIKPGVQTTRPDDAEPLIYLLGWSAWPLLTYIVKRLENETRQHGPGLARRFLRERLASCTFIRKCRFRLRTRRRSGAYPMLRKRSAASPHLTNAKVRTRGLVTCVQVEGHGEIRGDPQRESR